MIMTELYKQLQDIGNKVFDFLKQHLDKLDKDKLANPDLTKKDNPINTLFEKIKEKFGKDEPKLETPEANAPKKEDTTIERANPDKEPEIKNPNDKFAPKALTPEELEKQMATMAKNPETNNLNPEAMTKQLKQQGLEIPDGKRKEVGEKGKGMLDEMKKTNPSLDNDELRKMKDLGQR